MTAPRRSSMRTGAGDTEAVLITFFSARKMAAGQTTRVGFPFHLQRGDPYGLSIRNRTRQESRKLCPAHDKRGTPMKELTQLAVQAYFLLMRPSRVAPLAQRRGR